ncbi:MAG TPA: hypothetical protein VK150_07005, partial [Geothrix sp.]|nr:hypothetical protein [Geothrix sp.]
LEPDDPAGQEALLRLQSRWFTAAEVARMEEILAARRTELSRGYDPYAITGIVEQLSDLCRERSVPLPLRSAMGRCL